MLYLFDANVLIDWNRDHYRFNDVPPFWDWLQYHAKQGNVKIPIEIYEEIKEPQRQEGETRNPFFEWLKDKEIKKILVLNEDVNEALVSRVTDEGYGNDLTDDEIEVIGRDPFLIAYALASQGDRCVVTKENSKPSAKRQNRQIPDVCDGFNVKWCTPPAFTKELKFSVNWKDLIN